MSKERISELGKDGARARKNRIILKQPGKPPLPSVAEVPVGRVGQVLRAKDLITELYKDTGRPAKGVVMHPDMAAALESKLGTPVTIKDWNTPTCAACGCTARIRIIGADGKGRCSDCSTAARRSGADVFQAPAPADNYPRCVTCGLISLERTSVNGVLGFECAGCHAYSMKKILDEQKAEAHAETVADLNETLGINQGDSVDAFQKWLTTVPFPQSKRCDYLSLLTMNLGGESGEVIELLKKHIRDDSPIDLPHLILELGDVMIILSDIATHFKVLMSQIMGAAKTKTQGRMDRGTLRGKGDDR